MAIVVSVSHANKRKGSPTTPQTGCTIATPSAHNSSNPKQPQTTQQSLQPSTIMNFDTSSSLEQPDEATKPCRAEVVSVGAFMKRTACDELSSEDERTAKRRATGTGSCSLHCSPTPIQQDDPSEETKDPQLGLFDYDEEEKNLDTDVFENCDDYYERSNKLKGMPRRSSTLTMMWKHSWPRWSYTIVRPAKL
jgi:hypothetical protein